MKVHFFSKIEEDLIQYVSEGRYEDDVLSFYEEVEKGNRHFVQVFVYEDRLEMKKTGEISSHFIFHLDKKTEVIYRTSFGNMNFHIHTTALNMTKTKIYIEYKAFFDDENTSNVKLWLIIK